MTSVSEHRIVKIKTLGGVYKKITHQDDLTRLFSDYQFRFSNFTLPGLDDE